MSIVHITLTVLHEGLCLPSAPRLKEAAARTEWHHKPNFTLAIVVMLVTFDLSSTGRGGRGQTKFRAHVKLELAQNWLTCTQPYSLVGHRLPYLSSSMVVGKVDLRVNFILGAFAAMSGMWGKYNFLCVSEHLGPRTLSDREFIEKLICILEIGLVHFAEVHTY